MNQNRMYDLLEKVAMFFCHRRKEIVADIKSGIQLLEDGKLYCEEELERLKLIVKDTDKMVLFTKDEMIVESEKKDIEVHQLKESLGFLASVLSAEQDESNKAFQDFLRLAKIDFMEFANKESSLAAEALAVRRMDHIRDELNMILNYSAILTKTVVAVGGGFSSGKSAFINSLIKDKSIRLPEGIRPVTAIPTYVIHSDGGTDEIRGYSSRGGKFSIEKPLYEKIDHDFISTLGFNLKNIVPYMSIQTILKKDIMDNICFIDTPGYNPASSGSTEKDVETANEYIRDAECLIWLIPVKHGTVPSSDLHFLDELGSKKRRKLFFLISRANDVPQDDLERVLETVQEVLEENYVDYEGIAAYDSYSDGEYPFRKKSLEAFLEKNNQPGNRVSQLQENIDEVFDMYKEAIKMDKMRNEDITRCLKSLLLDVMEIGSDDTDVDIEGRIHTLQNSFKTKIQEESLQTCEKLRREFKETLSEFGKSIS